MIQEYSLALLISTAGIAVAMIVLLRLRQHAKTQGGSTTALTGLVLAAPVALLTVIGGLAVVTALDLNRPASARTNDLLVEAAAVDCGWRFDYVQSGVRTEELVLPVGRPVRIDITSLDSVHSFSVPGLSLAGEAQPQRWTTLALTPKEIDDYPLASEKTCAEQADGWVRVVEPMAFQSWLAEQPPSPRPTLVVSPAERGQQLAETSGCLGCHSVDGSELAGPTLKGLYGAQRALEDGSTVLVDDAYLLAAIRDPGAQIAAGFPDIMPPAFTMLSNEEVQAMIAYIASLD